MNILHITAYHSSTGRGGTEAYIDALTLALTKNHIPSQAIVLNTLPVLKEENSVWHLAPENDSPAAQKELKAKIREQIHGAKTECIFIHTSDTWEYLAAEVAVEEKIPYFYFFHAESWLCYQKNLKFLQKQECTTLFHPFRCSLCVNSGGTLLNGVFRTAAGEIRRLLGLKKISCLNSYRSELPKKEYIIRHAVCNVVFTEKDRQLFLKNGISSEHIALIPQELSEERLKACLTQAQKERSGVLKFGYIGRCCEIKGCHLLVEAALQIPQTEQFQLDIFGCNWNLEYCRKLREHAKSDPRIVLHEMIPAENIPGELGKMDVLCIPSIVFETGPYTLREGVYSGCLTAGSDQIGQMDFLLKYGKLISNNSVESWHSFFADCIKNMELIRQQRKTDFPEAATMESCAERFTGIVKSKNATIYSNSSL